MAGNEDSEMEGLGVPDGFCFSNSKVFPHCSSFCWPLPFLSILRTLGSCASFLGLCCLLTVHLVIYFVATEEMGSLRNNNSLQSGFREEKLEVGVVKSYQKTLRLA